MADVFFRHRVKFERTAEQVIVQNLILLAEIKIYYPNSYLIVQNQDLLAKFTFY